MTATDSRPKAASSDDASRSVAGLLLCLVEFEADPGDDDLCGALAASQALSTATLVSLRMTRDEWDAPPGWDVEWVSVGVNRHTRRGQALAECSQAVLCGDGVRRRTELYRLTLGASPDSRVSWHTKGASVGSSLREYLSRFEGLLTQTDWAVAETFR